MKDLQSGQKKLNIESAAVIANQRYWKKRRGWIKRVKVRNKGRGDRKEGGW